MSRKHIRIPSKKRIISIVMLVLVANIMVNVALTAPLAYMDFKLLYVKYDEEASTPEYSVLIFKVLARNDFFLPAKVERIDFEIFEEETGGLIGVGGFGPVILDPGQMGMITVVIKLYKTDATIRFIKNYLKTNKLKARIKAYYPITFFGFFGIFRFPVEVDMERILPVDESNIAQVGIMLPEFQVREISLTRETEEFAEAKINAYGVVPSELSGIGRVYMKEMTITITNDVGHVLDMELEPFVLDSNIGKFDVNITLRFIKGTALKAFLDRAIRRNEFVGRAKVKFTLTIFGMDLNDMEYEVNLSQFSGFFGGSETEGTQSGIFSAISGIFSDMFRISSIRYLGEEGSRYGPEHIFRLETNVRNPSSWTLGWGNINITLTKTSSGGGMRCISIMQKESILVKPNQATTVEMDVLFYDNDALYSMMKDILYRQEYNFNLTGYLDVYFAGVWLRGISLDSPVASFMGGDEGSPAGFLGGTSPIGGLPISGGSDYNFSISSYDILSTPREVILKAQSTIEYDRMPIAIHNVSGEIFYDGTYVGSVQIDRIELYGNNDTAKIQCRPMVEVRISKSSPVLGEFLNSFIRGDWAENTEFIGTVDLKFLSRCFPNVPLRIGGDMFGGMSSESLPVESMSKFYTIRNITYIGERQKGQYGEYVLLVDVEIINPLSSPLKLDRMNLDITLENPLYPEKFANIRLKSPVVIGSKGIGEAKVIVTLYDNQALDFYLNRTIRGYPVTIIANGALRIDIGGLYINTTEYRTRIASTMMNAVSSAAQIQYSMFYKSLQLLNITEHSDWIEIYVSVNTSIPLPLTINRLKVWASLNKDTDDYPVVLEVVDRLAGPGENQALIRITLYNTSREFSRFVKEFVYGDNQQLFIDLSMDLELFGRRFEGVQLFDILLNTSQGDSQSAFSVLKFDNQMGGGLKSLSYNGRTIVDGMEAYNLTLELEFRNSYGLTITFGNATIYIRRDGQKVARIDIKNINTISPYGSGSLKVGLYIFRTAKLAEFLEDLLVYKVFDAEVEGEIYIRIFGVELPNVRFIYRILLNLARESGVSQYYDVGLMYNASLADIRVLENTENITRLDVDLEVSNITLPVRLYYIDLNISLPTYREPALRILINNTIDVEGRGVKLFPVRVTILKSDIEHVREFLRLAIESKLRAINVRGITHMELFGVNLTLPFDLYNLSMAPTTSQIAVGGTLPDIAFNIKEIRYDGETWIDGRKAYVLEFSSEIDNILGIDIGIGPFDIMVIRDNTEVVGIYLDEEYQIKPYDSSMINITVIFFSGDKTYGFLRDLIENFTLDATITGYGNITLFGIDIPNIDVSYGIFTSFRRGIAGGSIGSIPLPEIYVSSYDIYVIGEDNDTASILIDVNFTNSFIIPFTLWCLNVTIYKQGEKSVDMVVCKPIDLEQENLSMEFQVTIHKTNATIRLIRDLVARKISQVDIIGSAEFMFLEWNFTIDIDSRNVSYSSTGQGGAVAPLGFDNVISLIKIRQISDMGLRLYLNFNNIVNTTISFGHLYFDIYYNDVRVLYVEMPEYYEVAPDSNATMIIDIYFENKSETGEFLRELLVNRTFNGRVKGVADIFIFGLNITRLSVSEYILASFTDTTAGGGIGPGALPRILSIELLSSQDMGSYLEIETRITLGESPLSFRLKNLNLKIRNRYGAIGEIRIGEINAKYGRNITADVFLRLYDAQPNRQLEKLIRDIVEKKLLDVSVEGSVDINMFGFDIYGVPINMYINQTLEGGSDGSSISSFVFPFEDLIIFDNIEQKTFGPNEFLLNVSMMLRSPLDTNVVFSDMNISVLKSGTRMMDIVGGGEYSIVGDRYSRVDLNVTFFDVPEFHDFIWELVVRKEINVSIIGKLNLALLGAYIDDLAINYTITTSGDGSAASTYAQKIVGFSSLGMGMSVKNVTYLGEDGVRTNTSVLVEIEESPIYMRIYYVDITVGNDLGEFIDIHINKTVELNVSEISQLEILMSIIKGSDALRRFLTEYLRYSETTVDIEGRVKFQLFSPSAQYTTFELELDIEDFRLGSSGIAESTGSIMTVPLTGSVEILSSEKIGEEGEGYLKIEIQVSASNIPIPLTIKNLNITLANEYSDQYGPVMEMYIPYAELYVDKESSFNMTLKIFDRIPNRPLAKFIRDIVERKILDVDINGSVDIEIFGVSISDVPIKVSVNQSLDNGEDSGISSGSIFLPVQQLFVFNSIRQITSPTSTSPYNFEINASLKSPLNITIGIGDIDITVYRNDEPAIRLLMLEYYQINPDDYTHMVMNLKIYDSQATNRIITELLQEEVLDATIVGRIDLDFLGAHLDNLNLNLTIHENVSSYSEGVGEAVSFASPSTSYKVSELSMKEDNYYSYVEARVEVEGVPIYLEIYHLNLTLSNEYGEFLNAIINDTSVLSPFDTSEIHIYLRFRRGSQALEKFLNEYLREPSTRINIEGMVYAKLFGKYSQYLTFEIPINLSNMTYTSMNSSSSGGPLVPIDITQYLGFKAMEYIGPYYDDDIDCMGYRLNISFDFTNRLNISFGVTGAEFHIIRNDVEILSGILESLYAGVNENVSTYALITLYDRPETAVFLQDLLNNYELSFTADVYVDSISIFGVTISNISLSQVMNWNVSRQVEGSEVQSSVLSMFNMTIGGIKVIGEDVFRAEMEINITVFNSKITVYIDDLALDILYSDTKVAHVFINELYLDTEENTTFTTTLIIFKDNREALQGFLNDLLVRKNVTMDITGDAQINLFGSQYLNLNLSFEYNNIVYCVEDYYQSLMSGEVDTSSLLDEIIEYSAEDVKWEFLGENDTHVVIRLSEKIRSSLNIKIYDMLSYLYIEPLNDTTLFAIQRLVGDVDIPADGEGDITIELVFLKNEYLQDFLEGVLHEWSIEAWIDTTIDLQIFGVDIRGMRAVSVRYSYIITQDIIQSMVTGTVENYTSTMQSEAVSLEPLGYGNWYDSSDLYGGIEEVVKNVAAYAVRIWENDPQYINVWNYRWILLKYNQSIGTYDFRVSISEFRAIMVFTGTYMDGGEAQGTVQQDYIGEIYIDNLTLLPDKNNTFYAYVRFWRQNRFNNMENSRLKDFVWGMVNSIYSFSVVNVSFNLAMWGCYIPNVTLEGLNFTGVVDLSDIGSMIEFGGMSSWTVGINWGEGVYFDAKFKVRVPMSPEWMIYYSMLITWDDDPIFFEDADTCADDPPTTGDYSDSATRRISEVEELIAPDPNAQPLAHDKNEFWVAPQLKDAPTSIPDYAVWFGGGGEYELFVRLDIEWTDAFHDYIGNAYVDQNYDDEELTAQGKAEREDAYAPVSPWEGVEDGDMWVLVFFSYETEILMFWWVIYYYTPSFYIVSGDYNPNIVKGRIYINKTWVLHDYNWVYQFELYGDKINVNGAKIFDLEVAGGQMFIDSYDGQEDTSEPDWSGNYHL